MREILFRGKTRDGRWVYGSLIRIGTYCCILQEDDGTNCNYPYLDNLTGCIDGYATPILSKTIGQWTGVFDKNGKMIFEGDIVKCNDTIRSVEFNEHYLEFEFGSRDPVPNPDSLVLCGDHKYCEVIGNVHDSPELLKGE